jgi:septum formation topological specificity factor MinE
MVKLVYDPINLENIPLDDYLKNDTNNIVVILNNKAYGVNKALFMFNNEMKRCIIANTALLKKATYDNPETYYNIGYFIGKKVIVNQNILNDVLKNHRIIELTSKTTGDTYINKEFLELTTIGILKQSEYSIGKVNFKHAYEDVYFDELISHLLEQYSFVLFHYINNILLNQEKYNKKYNNNKSLDKELIDVLLKYVKVRDKKIFKNIDYKNAIDNAITNIDKAFIEAALRYEKAYIHKVFYRGMKKKYINTNGNKLENKGDIAIILNYTSVTSSYSEATKFALGKDAVIYKIYLEEGMPFINMVSTARWKSEEEYLLPRNLIFEVISKKETAYNENDEYTILVKPFKPDQFAIKTGCIPLNRYDIVPSTISYIQSPKKLSIQSTPSQLKVKSKSSSSKSKKVVIPVKLKRCPNGMVRNKITNECVPKPNNHVKQDIKATPKANAKIGRCPNGTRRNPKTLLCEPKL